MKKILILTIAILTLNSCSPSDDNSSVELIIGNWSLIREYSTPSNDCEKNTTITFESNNVLKLNVFKDTGNDCIAIGETLGTWEEGSSNNTYILNRQGLTAEETTVVFSNNNNQIAFMDGNSEALVYARN